MRAFRERFGPRDGMVSILVGSLAILVASFATFRPAVGDDGPKAQANPKQSADTSATWCIHTLADGTSELVVVATYPAAPGPNGSQSFSTASTMLKSASAWTAAGVLNNGTAITWALISQCPAPLERGGTITYYFQPSKAGPDDKQGTGSIRVVTLYTDQSCHPLGHFTHVNCTPATPSKRTPTPGKNPGA